MTRRDDKRKHECVEHVADCPRPKRRIGMLTLCDESEWHTLTLCDESESHHALCNKSESHHTLESVPVKRACVLIRYIICFCGTCLHTDTIDLEYGWRGEGCDTLEER